MATPATTKAKPDAGKPASPPPPPRTRREIDADDKAARQGSGWGAFVLRQFEKLRGVKPDHSVEGFVAAVRAGIQFVSKKDWNTADDMLEELEHQIRTALRVPGGVSCDYVARDRETKQPRILVLTEWGLREAVEGQISFQLHYKPDRMTPRGPANG
jgi:hypothetical protein